MKRSKKTKTVGADGTISGLRAVGHHGQLGQDQTPARRAAVLVNEHDQVVEIAEVRPGDATKGARSRGLEVQVEVIGKLDEDGGLPGIGTRIGPWPARLHAEVVVLGNRERCHLDSIARRAVEGEPARVREFLGWLAQDEPRSAAITCERVGGLVAWYCSEDEAFALWRRIQAVAREEVSRAARSRDPDALREVSFWLSRAAIADEDIYLAVAGLRRAGYPHWEVVLRAGVQQATDAERRAALRSAEEELERQSAAPPGTRGIPSAIRERQRKAIDASFEILAA